MQGNYKHGMRYTRIYDIWRAMRQRCQNPNCINYHNYGGKGIRVCEEWDKNFQTFYEWANQNGYEDHLTIDRIDVNGNYCPENCRWSSYKNQANNKSNNRYLEYNGELHTLGEWSEITGIKLATIWARMKRGWTVCETVTIPVGEKKGNEKMTINSKQKGARFERLLASKFREYGYKESRRTAQYCGNTGDASDVVGLPGIHVEAKHQERMQLYDWIDQAKRDAEASGADVLPAVFHKKNNCEILVTMTLDDWMTVYREYEAGLDRKEWNKQFPLSPILKEGEEHGES